MIVVVWGMFLLLIVEVIVMLMVIVKMVVVMIWSVWLGFLMLCYYLWLGFFLNMGFLFWFGLEEDCWMFLVEMCLDVLCLCFFDMVVDVVWSCFM